MKTVTSVDSRGKRSRANRVRPGRVDPVRPAVVPARRRSRIALSLAMAVNLFLLPMPRVDGSRLLAAVAYTAREASTAARDAADKVRREIKSVFKKSPRQMGLADRLGMCAAVRISPSHLVGYQNEIVSFSGLPLSVALSAPSVSGGAVVHGAKLSWDTSDHTKAVIDETGRAELLAPGLVWVVCRAGLATASVPVLVRAGSRGMQTQKQWNQDQGAINDAGSPVSALPGSALPGSAALLLQAALGLRPDQPDSPDRSNGVFTDARPSIVRAAYKKPIPSSFLQGGGGSSLDYLWNYVPNLVGAPRNAAIEPTRLGPVLPESNNFHFTSPILSLSGRGLSVNLALSYNSRLWFRNGSNITYSPLPGFPAPGCYIGYGYIATYTSSFAPFDTGYLLIDSAGTPPILATEAPPCLAPIRQATALTSAFSVVRATEAC